MARTCAVAQDARMSCGRQAVFGGVRSIIGSFASMTPVQKRASSSESCDVGSGRGCKKCRAAYGIWQHLWKVAARPAHMRNNVCACVWREANMVRILRRLERILRQIIACLSTKAANKGGQLSRRSLCFLHYTLGICVVCVPMQRKGSMVCS